MNYRHAFHAGNFADILKHAALLAVLARMTADPEPFTVIDTHAGRGVYDLQGDDAQRSGEAKAGIAKLMEASDLSAALGPLRHSVAALNSGGSTRRYPGSPLLIAGALRVGDAYVAYELRPEEQQALDEALKGRRGVQTICADGFALALDQAPSRGRVLVLIDPPFERSDDYLRSVQTLAALVRRNPQACVMIWTPIKDLETFDGFLREAELSAPLLVAEARIRPLSDPMRMNGCAMVVAGAPGDLDGELAEICGWIVSALGERGQARVWRTVG